MKIETLDFETILDEVTVPVAQVEFSEENYCPDCYDCDYNCTAAN